jgi:uncharacterized membrane protein HdeD (DUF308 family)
MKLNKVWHLAVGLVLVFWGLLLLEWLTLENSDVVLGVGAIIAGVLVIIDK